MNELPKHYDLIVNGINARNENDFEKALDLFEQAEQYPEIRGVAYYEQGVTYFHLKNNDSSKKLLRLALQESKESVPMRLFFADLLIDEKEYNEAKEFIEEALHIDSSYNYAHTVMRRLLKDQSGVEAEYHYFREILPKFADNHELLYDFAFFIITSYTRKDRILLIEALECLNKIKNEGYENESLEYHLAKTCFLLSNDEACITHLMEYVKKMKSTDPSAELSYVQLFVEDKKRKFYEEQKPAIEDCIGLLIIESIEDSENGSRDMKRGETLRLK